MATIRPKLQRQEAFERHFTLLRILVGLQKEMVQRANRSEDPAAIHLQRLDLYDGCMKIFVDQMEQLAPALLSKQPGGPKKNKYRHLALDAAIEFYCTHGKFPKSKELIRMVAVKNPEVAENDGNDREKFSERIARDVIRSFKADITIDDDDVTHSDLEAMNAEELFEYLCSRLASKTS